MQHSDSAPDPVPDILIVYEHPVWFAPLFAALEARGVNYAKLSMAQLTFDPADRTPPAPVIFNRLAMSSILRAEEHGIFAAQAAFDHWEACGARVINGAEALGYDASKARQLAKLSTLGIGFPATRIVHRADQVMAAGAAIGFPLLVKANIGGAGAGIVRYDDADALATAVAAKALPDSVDGVLLVQRLATPRGGTITRIETLAHDFLYAIAVSSGGDSFDLCPADACIATPGKPAITMTRVDPDPAYIAAAETIVAACGIDVGGVEMLIDDESGEALFYDVNALSNFVADPLEVLGWDPHEQLVTYLIDAIAKGKA